MKKIIINLIVLCMLISLSGSAMAQSKEKETVVFSVLINCGNCEKKLKDNLRFEKGVTNIKTDLEAQTVTITFKPDKTTKEDLASALKKFGFDAHEKTVAGAECEIPAPKPESEK